MHLPLGIGKLLSIFILFISPGLALAINVVPFSGELDLSKQSNYKFKVLNPSSNETAVKISVVQWKINEQGEEIRIPDSELTIFPKRLLIKPKGERSVRVSYRNNSFPAIEKTYRIIVEQVPVNRNNKGNSKRKAAINILTKYVTSFYVKPRDANSKISVISSNSIENGFSLKIRNDGNAHTHFIQPSMTIQQSDNKLFISDLTLLESFARTNIFALGERHFEWKIPENFQDTLNFEQPYEVTIDWTCENCQQEKDNISFVVE